MKAFKTILILIIGFCLVLLGTELGNSEMPDIDRTLILIFVALVCTGISVLLYTNTNKE